MWSFRHAIYLHQSSLEWYYKVKLWLVPPKLEERCGKAEGLRWWVGSLGGLKTKNLRGCRPQGGLSEGLSGGGPFVAVYSIVVQFMCVQHSDTAPVCAVNVTVPVRAVQWYSICVCSTVVQHLCGQYSCTSPVCAVQWWSTCVCSTVVQHLCAVEWYNTHVFSGTALVCAAQWYSTCVCSTVVQHLCVQYSGTALVCAVQWYSTRVCSTVVQHLCVQCTTPFTNFQRLVTMLCPLFRCANINCKCATPVAVGVQNSLSCMHVSDRGLGAFSTESRGSTS